MRRIHLLRVAEGPQAFAPLFAAAAAACVRVGWLELPAGSSPSLDSFAGSPLSAVLGAGAARAAVAADAWTVSARPRRGPARLRELLRQQFLGCALVLVCGEVDAPTLAPSGNGEWSVAGAGVAERRLSGERLIAALREPLPFAPARPVT
jgi:hypothetical protein